MGRRGRRYGSLRLRGNGSVLLFELLYQAVFFTAVSPVFGVLFRLALWCSPYSYVTLQNLPAFLRRPVTLLCLFVFLALVAFLMYLETVCLYTFFEIHLHGRKIRMMRAVMTGIITAVRLLRKPKNLLLLPVSLACSFVFVLPYTILYIVRTRIPGYIIQSAFGEPAAAAALTVALLLLLYLSLRSMFAIPFAVHTGGGAVSCLKESAALFRGNAGFAVRRMLLVNLFFLSAYILFYVFCIVTAGVVLFFFVDKSLVVAVYLSVMERIEVYTGVLGMVLGLLVNCGQAAVLFHTLVPAEEYPEERAEYEEKGRNRRQRWGAVLILVLLGVINTVYAARNGSILSQETLAGIGITAHRGASFDAPENTLPALELAIEYMADYAEIDVQMTKDGVIVLLHDSSLRRTTGLRKYIWDVTYEEIRELDVGSYVSREYAGVGIPTLEEALILCKGRINLNIEIKTNARNSGLTAGVLELIEEYDFENQCIISSTDYNALVEVKESYPGIKTGYIMGLAYGYFYDREYADFFSIKSSFITDSVVRIAHSLGKEIHAWTVNTEGELERMKQLQVDNIITDRPVRAREVLYRDEFGYGFAGLLKVISEAR